MRYPPPPPSHLLLSPHLLIAFALGILVILQVMASVKTEAELYAQVRQLVACWLVARWALLACCVLACLLVFFAGCMDAHALVDHPRPRLVRRQSCSTPSSTATTPRSCPSRCRHTPPRLRMAEGQQVSQQRDKREITAGQQRDNRETETAERRERQTTREETQRRNSRSRGATDLERLDRETPDTQPVERQRSRQHSSISLPQPMFPRPRRPLSSSSTTRSKR